MPRLIVMMPVKNVRRTIRAALTSTLRALPDDAKIVVWDDASSDGTLSVVDEFLGSRVELMTSDHSVGGGAARAAIMKNSDSEFIASMDGDDICLPWRFVRQLNYVNEFDAVFMTNVKFGQRLRDFRPGLPLTYGAIDTAVALVFHNPLTHPSLLARRQVLENVGGYRNLRVAQDYDLWMRIVSNGYKIGRLGLPGIAYRQSATQVSKQDGYVYRIRTQREIIDSFFSLLEHLSPGLAGIATDPSIEVAQKSELIERAIRCTLPRMTPVLRHYYRHLMDQGRMGPLWGAWSLDSRGEL